jgi:hypothetical protein
MSGTSASDWVIETSKRTGLRYWFNKRTKQSTYDEPAELRADPPTAVTSTAIAAADLAEFSADELRGLQSEDLGRFRDAVESVCRRLQALASSSEDAPAGDPERTAWRQARVRRFAPHDRAHRTAITGIAEEYGLGSFVSQDAASGEKSVVVYVLVSSAPSFHVKVWKLKQHGSPLSTRAGRPSARGGSGRAGGGRAGTGGPGTPPGRNRRCCECRGSEGKSIAVYCGKEEAECRQQRRGPSRLDSRRCGAGGATAQRTEQAGPPLHRRDPTRA